MSDVKEFTIKNGVLKRYDGLGGDVVIPDGVVSIAPGAFLGMRSITSVTLPNGLKKICNNAFNNCQGITSIVIPDSVTTIEESAFEDCCSMMDITIPDSVVKIEKKAFDFTGYYREKSNWESDVLYIGKWLIGVTSEYWKLTGDYTVKEGSVGIADNAFWKCENMTGITFPDTIRSIGKYAFYGCKRLREVTLPNGLTSIECGVFSGCEGLSSINIPDSATSIGAEAFADCVHLANVAIPEGVQSVGGDAFKRTLYSNDESNRDNNVLYIGNWLIEAGKDISGSYEVKSGTVGIAPKAFLGCKGLTSITIPDSVTAIGSDAFFHCDNLAGIVMPDSVTSIGDNAFSCTAYEKDKSNWENGALYIGKWLVGVESGVVTDSYRVKDGTIGIASCGMQRCWLTAFEIPEGVKYLEEYSFAECTTLKSITIPESVVRIGKNAFSKGGKPLGVKLMVRDGSCAYNYAIENGLNYKIVK